MLKLLLPSIVGFSPVWISGAVGQFLAKAFLTGTTLIGLLPSMYSFMNNERLTGVVLFSCPILHL